MAAACVLTVDYAKGLTTQTEGKIAQEAEGNTQGPYSSPRKSA